MRKIIFLSALLIVLPNGFTANAFEYTPASASSNDLILVAVSHPDRGAVARLLFAEIMVIHDRERYLLIAASAADLVTMRAMGFSWKVLDENMSGKTYYTIYLGNERRRERLYATVDGAERGPGGKTQATVRILEHDPYEVVIEAAPEKAEDIAAAGFDIARLFLRPIRLPSEEKFRPRRVLTEPDALIETMVDSVSSSVIDAKVARLQGFVTRYSNRDSCQSAANYIKAQFESYGIDSVYFHHWSDWYKDNVVAVMPGVGSPEKIVIVGGHYDSTSPFRDNCPGADDNASGTAGVLECARVLGRYQYDYTLSFIAFCGEEQGLLGSRAFAEAAAARGDDIVGMLNIDMIGYVEPGDSTDLDIIDNFSSQWLRDLVMDVGALYVPELPMVDGDLIRGNSDHSSFWSNGYDAIMFFEDVNDYSPYIHSLNDVVGVSYTNPQLAVRSVRAAVALLATVADPFRVIIQHTPLVNTEDTQNPYHVAANLLAAGPLDPDSMFVVYENEMGTFTVPLNSTGAGNGYEAYIPAQVGGTRVQYYIVAENTDGYRAHHPKNAPDELNCFVVGTPVVLVEEDFETDSGWIVGDVDDDATGGIWVRADPNGTSFYGPVQPEDDHTADPGVMCFVTGNAPPGSAQWASNVDNGKTTLSSPVYDLSAYANLWLRYYRWYSNDTGVTEVTDDWVVDVSPDSGQSWVRIETLPASDRTWRFIERYIPDYITPTSSVQFRFVASDDDPSSIIEAALDDFSITAYIDTTTTVVGSPSLPPGLVRLDQNYPNPFNPETQIRIAIGGPGEIVTLRIYDVTGRAVASLLESEHVAGEKHVRWNGRDRNGRQVATGVYFYRLEAGGRILSKKLVVLR
jgi:hypothetical protein